VPRLSRILFAFAALLFSGMLVLPVWRISLIAPQYPEGLGMVIDLHTLHGVKEHDLVNINELNHYIGMRVIDPQQLPEFRVLPWLVGGLALLALAVAVTGRRKLGWAWIGGVLTFATLGLLDFWRVSYDFGHNLDFDDAIIKVPGMVYQPPVIGVKQILNFTASSWPASGTWLAAFAVAVGVFALLWRRKASPVPVEASSEPREVRSEAPQPLARLVKGPGKALVQVRG
jgi:copper chaperone NosL